MKNKSTPRSPFWKKRHESFIQWWLTTQRIAIARIPSNDARAEGFHSFIAFNPLQNWSFNDSAQNTLWKKVSCFGRCSHSSCNCDYMSCFIDKLIFGLVDLSLLNSEYETLLYWLFGDELLFRCWYNFEYVVAEMGGESLDKGGVWDIRVSAKASMTILAEKRTNPLKVKEMTVWFTKDHFLHLLFRCTSQRCVVS